MPRRAGKAFPLSDVPWADERASAIEAAFGAPATVQHLPFPVAVAWKTPPIHVWVWPNRFGPGNDLLMTEGISDVNLRHSDGEPGGKRLELLTITNQPTWGGNLLRTVGQTIISSLDRRYMAFDSTLALSNPPAPLTEGSKLTRVVFLVPPEALIDAGEKLMPFEIEGDGLMVLWCNGITEGEFAAKNSMSSDLFAELL